MGIVFESDAAWGTELQRDAQAGTNGAYNSISEAFKVAAVESGEAAAAVDGRGGCQHEHR